MAINPSSDIILEVARAADPERAAAVVRKLNGLASGAAVDTADFGAALETTRPRAIASVPGASVPGASVPGASVQGVPVQGVPDMRSVIGAMRDPAADRAEKAQVKFEAVLLNNFVSEMLPKDAPEAFGEGYAGEMWRSLLAEKISDQLAGSDALGLRERLWATHPFPTSSRLTSATRQVGAAIAQMSAIDLSTPSGADVGEGSDLLASAKPR